MPNYDFIPGGQVDIYVDNELLGTALPITTVEDDKDGTRN